MRHLAHCRRMENRMTVRSLILAGSAIWTLATPSFAAKASSAETRIVDGTTFGPTRTLRGVYFTNFENSVFAECTDDKSCSDWASGGQSWVHCQPKVCADLEKRIAKLNGNHDNWGTFAGTFEGRRGLTKRTKRFLNDREDDILIEKIVDFRLIESSTDSKRLSEGDNFSSLEETKKRKTTGAELAPVVSHGQRPEGPARETSPANWPEGLAEHLPNGQNRPLC